MELFFAAADCVRLRSVSGRVTVVGVAALPFCVEAAVGRSE